MGKKTLSRQAQDFDELTFEELCNVCRNIVEGAMVTEEKGVHTFAEFLNKVRQLRHTQKRATYNPNIIDKKEKQEREIDLKRLRIFVPFEVNFIIDEQYAGSFKSVDF